MLSIVIGIVFAALAFCLGLICMSPEHVTRDDNPITGRLFAFAAAIVCLFAASYFIFGG